MGYKSPLNMFPAQRWRQNFFLGGGALTYDAKVLGHDPIAYWPLTETSGLVANCLVNPAQNGVYTGVTLGQPGIGDGNTAPFFDGANDSVDIYSAALNAAFNGAEGTIVIWFKVFNAGVWTDATDRRGIQIYVDGDNRAQMMRPAGDDNRIFQSYEAGNITETNYPTIGPSINWFHIAMAWSKAGEVINYYTDGAPSGSDINLGVWAGALNPAECYLGNSSWYGWMAHPAIFDSALAAESILDLATV